MMSVATLSLTDFAPDDLRVSQDSSFWLGIAPEMSAADS